jgi:hypothetical protein
VMAVARFRTQRTPCLCIRPLCAPEPPESLNPRTVLIRSDHGSCSKFCLRGTHKTRMRTVLVDLVWFVSSTGSVRAGLVPSRRRQSLPSTDDLQKWEIFHAGVHTLQPPTYQASGLVAELTCPKLRILAASITHLSSSWRVVRAHRPPHDPLAGRTAARLVSERVGALICW